MIGWVPGIILSAAILFAIVELASRWWIRRRSRYHVWPPGLRIELHADLEVLPQLEPRARFEINADGERGSDVRGDEAGLFRVLVAGGSAVECLALDQSTSWPGAVERLLSAEQSLRILGARQVHVGNIGRSGIACRHLDLIFERVLPQYRSLAAIVIMVGAGDVVQWLEDGAPQSLPRSPAREAGTLAYHREEPFGWTPSHWATLALARRLRRSCLRPVEVRERAGRWMADARRMRAQAKEVRTSVVDPAGMLQRFEYHFARLVEQAKAHADRVLVVRQPWFEKEYTAEETACLWHGGIGKAWKQPVTTYYALGVVNRLMALVDARATAVVDRFGVEQLDLRPVLAASLENYYDFVHYTPAGSAVVARAVAAALLRRPAPRKRSRAPDAWESSSAVPW